MAQNRVLEHLKRQRVDPKSEAAKVLLEAMSGVDSSAATEAWGARILERLTDLESVVSRVMDHTEKTVKANKPRPVNFDPVRKEIAKVCDEVRRIDVRPQVSVEAPTIPAPVVEAPDLTPILAAVSALRDAIQAVQEPPKRSWVMDIERIRGNGKISGVTIREV